jgi:hypothetical protein
MKTILMLIVGLMLAGGGSMENHVRNRKAARLCGRNQSERNAIVIDCFFYTKEKALAWVKANPHFMVVRVRTPDTEAAY